MARTIDTLDVDFTMKRILLLKGLNPNADVFSKLVPLLPNSECIEWIAPANEDSLTDYSNRLIDAHRIDYSCDILGVSFGGMIAQEIARLIRAKCCFVVSSILSPKELSTAQKSLKILPKWGSRILLRALGLFARHFPRKLSPPYLAQARRLGGAQGTWYRWATNAVIHWMPNGIPTKTKIVRIHGNRDRTFPLGHLHADHVIDGGGHLLAVTHAEAIGKIVRGTIS